MTARYWLYLTAHAVVFCVGLLATRSASIVLQGIGASLVAAGITGWVVFLYLFVSESAAERQALIAATGLQRVYSYRGVAIRSEYTDRLLRARRTIDLIGYGLRSLREDFGYEFAEWAARAQVRILLIDPQGALADQRDIEEHTAVGTIRREVEQFLGLVAPLTHLPTFQVRLYTTLPAINYFRIDDDLFWGPYLVGKTSRNTPTFLVRRGGVLWNPLVEHFDTIWNDNRFSRPVSPPVGT